jgi:hypothetical protein
MSPGGTGFVAFERPNRGVVQSTPPQSGFASCCAQSARARAERSVAAFACVKTLRRAGSA